MTTKYDDLLIVRFQRGNPSSEKEAREMEKELKGVGVTVIVVGSTKPLSQEIEHVRLTRASESPISGVGISAAAKVFTCPDCGWPHNVRTGLHEMKEKQE